MNKKISFLPFLIHIFLLNFLLTSEPIRKAPGIRLPTSQELNIQADFGRMPLYFIPNEGQVDNQIDFYVQGKDKIIYFKSDGVTFLLQEPDSSNAEADGRDTEKEFPSRMKQISRRWVVNLDFVGGRADVRPVGEDKTGAVISYFKGKPEDWHTGLPAYSRIVYPNLWPGIDLVYYGTVNRLKYEFIVNPGADPSRIRLAYRGATGVVLDQEGRIEVRTPAGGFHDDCPDAYQEVGGERVKISLSYELQALEEEAGKEDVVKEGLETPRYVYGFEVGDYDQSLPLVLDPAILVYCGYIGSYNPDYGHSIAVDSSGCAYVTGYTDFISPAQDADAFVAKVNASGTSLVYLSYFLGADDDYGNGIAVDGSGCAYVTGTTDSEEDTFPVTNGPGLFHNGQVNLTDPFHSDAFVAKLNSSGTKLVFCGYIGGLYNDSGKAIAVDSSGDAYVIGKTGSTQAEYFPVTVGPDLTYNAGVDAFVAKVDASGTALAYCGYIGGSGYDYGYGIAVDALENAYVTGLTASNEATFPVMIGPDLTHNGDWDAFVAKVDTSGTALAYCGYIGGTALDYGFGIAVDALENAYVTGRTESNEATFPVTVGPDLTHNGDWDAFVAKVDTSGTALAYCGYIGGTALDYGFGIAVDALENAYVTGLTGSHEATFPVTVGPDLTYNGGDRDAFVAKVNASGTSLAYCGYIGGSFYDSGTGITVDKSGNAYVTGRTDSGAGSFPVTVGPDLTHNGQQDVFVAKVSHKTVLPDAPSNPSPSDGATGVLLSTDLDWNNSSWATSYDVYFGKSSAPPYVGNVTESSYNPVALDSGTGYHWKVVAKNELGETPGPEWSFTTCTLPDTPSNLSPSNGTSDVSLDTDLDWEDSSGVASYDVYLGISSPPPYVNTVTESYYDPGLLGACSTYYWKIVAKNDCGEAHGDEWNFTTLFASPEPFSNLSPSDGATNVPLDSVLNWEDSNNATSYDVYLGTDSPPPYVATVAESYYDPGPLDASTTYHWMVVAKGCAEIAGDEWSFTTGEIPWTFMVYLDGDNNLEWAGIVDFLEMASIGSTNRVNIVVQFDRIDGETGTFGDWTTTKRFYITKYIKPYAENALEDLGELNHGDPQTLIDFINWAKENYPAQNYALVLWNHGGGWRESKQKEIQAKLKGKERPFYRAVCWDDTDGEDTLYMDEVQSALHSTDGANLIGFDACLMGMVEVAYEIKDYGEVMVGSEESEPNDGWPYDLILQDLVDNPYWSSSELGQAVVDRYYESYGDDETQSAIDLTALDSLAGSISSFAQALTDNWNTDESAVKSAASEVMTKFENAVINEQHGSAWPGANGMAIYFPSTSGEFDPDYESVIDFAVDTQWDEFLMQFHNVMGGSWITDRRGASQSFTWPEHQHIDLYHFCERLREEREIFYTKSQMTHEYLGGGTAWNFWGDESSRGYTLPFDFPYFGETIPAGTTIYVCTNGYVDFNDVDVDYINSGLGLASNKRIAPYWVDLQTIGSAQSGENVYITENADSVVIRWVAQTYYLAVPVNIELILYADGRIQFNYDGGNDLSATPYCPTVGISKGDGINGYFAVHNGQRVLTDADSVLFAPLSSEAPSAPENPSPVHEATDVSVEADLDWADCVGATSYDVYLGTSSPPPYAATVTSSYYEPGTLDEVTAYYWKIVAKNDYGETPGDEWQFTTGNLPGAFSNLTPSNGASDVSVDVDLDWEDSSGATSYDIYLGTSSPPSYVTSVTESNYDPGSLNACSTYYWKIVAKNDCGEAHGDEWDFTALYILPEPFSNLTPSNGATDVSLDVDLDWEDSSGATSYDVYLGTASPPPYIDTVTESYYDPGSLSFNKTYHWMVVAKNNCGNFSGDERSFSTRKMPWTFMVYLDGDNNLEGAGIDDFLEMAFVGSSDKINIVVQFDRISGEDNSYGDWTTTKRFYVTNGMTPEPENALEDLGELNHGDPQTLVDFINWAKENYPAQNYALVLWNHGGGWRESKEKEIQAKLKGKERPFYRAVCWDDTDGEDTLYMDEVQSALHSTDGANLIGFDACLMGMVEVAYEIKDYGEVMVGSEETEPSDGWPYNLILQDLVHNPSWSSSELGQAVVDRYHQLNWFDETQSAIDLTALDSLAGSISSFAQALMDNWNTDESAVKSAASEVMTQIENAVIHEEHGSVHPGAHGMAIYFPLTSGEFDPDYESVIDFADDTQWNEFLVKYNNLMGESWIADRRGASQSFTWPEHQHVDLYHFCEKLREEREIFYTKSQMAHEYLGGGTASGYHADESSMTYTLPFDFPYFGETITAGTTIYVCPNGYVDFNYSAGDHTNSGLELADNKRIAPYWIDLLTNGSAQSGEDFYITENADSVVIRWVAETYYLAVPVNIELILYADGRIQFNYDGGNDLSATPYSPTIGISKGDGIDCYYAVHNGQRVLTDADSVLFAPLSPEPPSTPENPSPVHEATDVSVEADLDWADCVGATSYDVYLGTSSPPPFVSTVFNSYYKPGTLDEGTTYYWKIVAKNDYGETEGSEWSFATCTILPGTFNYLTPSDGATGIALDADLDWSDSSGAVSYDVYFGTVNPPPYVDTISSSYFDPGQLNCATHYYWKVVGVNSCGTWEGGVFDFNTIICSSLPDLIVDSLTYSPQDPSTSDLVIFTAVVKNTGGAPSGSSHLEIKIGGESSPPVYEIPALNPEGTYPVERQETLSTVMVFLITATADINEEVAESNETNNVTTDTVTVYPHSFVVNIEPQGAIDAGAKWKRLCSTTWYDSGYEESGLHEGNVVVEFKEIAGWRKPENKIVSLAGGDPAVITGIYTLLFGSGTFIDSGQDLGSGYSYSIALGDVDGDSDLDAFVANSGNNKVWLNDGSGVFTDSGQSLGSSTSRGVALGDVDGDGDLDAFVANVGGNKVRLNDGNGIFTDSGQSLGNSSSRDVALGDVDCDGDLDVFVVNHGTNKLWLNDGSGTFTDSGQSPSSSSSYSYGIELGDIDGDGDLDAFVANSGSNKVWLNDGSGTFTDRGQSLGSSSSESVALGDVDGDGDLDAFVANRSSQGNKVWLNNGSATYLDSGQSLGGSSSYSYDVELGDVDGDGDLDAFVANSGSDKVWLNDGSGVFTDSGQSLGSSSSESVALGAVNGDSSLDAFVVNSSSSKTNKVWLNECVLPEITEHPQSQSIDYNTAAILSVTATSPDAISYQWYQGASGDTSSPVGTDSDSYTTPNLTETTSYWVRVSNICGSVDSETATICVLPATPTNLSPADESIEAPLDADLDWEESIGATSYDVYLGTSSPPPYVNTVTESYYDPGPLGGCSTYYWKIVAKNDCSEADGEEWSFSTIIILPQQFSNLSPSNGATEVPLDSDLDWEDSSGAASYDVYLGTSLPLPYVTTVSESFYDPGSLNLYTTYTWYIVAKNPCGNTPSDEWSFTTGKKTWTFIVYLDGDNNLEGAGIDDFLEMASVGSNEQINIVVQFDRIDGHNSSYGDWTTTKRFYITNGLTPDPGNEIEDLGELNHGDPQTLIDFINWTKENYPAQNYALVLWNHGGGWRLAIQNLWKKRDDKKRETVFKAVCWDETDGSDALYMDEVQSALSSSGGAELIGFDACLMGMVEVAYEIRNNGEVMVGSEELEPEPGWPYDKVLQDLTLNPTWSSSELGTAIVDRYYESYGSNHTQTAIDLSKMDSLASTVSSFAQAMIDNWDSDQDAVKNAAQAVMAEMNISVIHEQHGSLWQGAHGLAIYFPKMSGELSLDYDGSIIDFPNDTQWEEFLQEYYTSMEGSWIEQKRSAVQEFDSPEHIDLYNFCELINAEDYYAESQIAPEYIGGGAAQTFQEDDASITYTLPFNFSYFDEIIPAGSEIYICTNGFIDFAISSKDWSDTVSELISNKRIAPYWTDLTTDGSAQEGEDIYITENSDNLVIRWVAETTFSKKPVNLELILYDDGRIQFNYDGGNADLEAGESPTIGISRGNSTNYQLSVYNGENTLTNVDSDLFTPLDNPPSVSMTSPSDGDTVSGTVNIEASASDDNEVIKVEFFIDDELKSADTTSPYTYSWDTTTYSNGTHEVKAIAYDNINKTDYHEISVTVENYKLTISAGVGGTTDPAPGTYYYSKDEEVSITATADPGYEFEEWIGNVSSGHENDNPIIITMDSNKSITAEFYIPIPQVVISGSVKTSGGDGVEGVTITFSNEGGSTTTDSSGNYSHSVNEGWSGTATPSKVTYTFTPFNRSYENVTSDQISQDYTASLLTFTISGKVSTGEALAKTNVARGPRGEAKIELLLSSQTEKMSVSSSSGSMITQGGLSGVVMNGLPGNPITDASGNYSATVEYGWSGTVTPNKAGYTFSPTSIDYTDVTSDQADQDYTATIFTYTISGNVSTSDVLVKIQAAAELSGVLMDGLPGDPTTDASGNYSATVDYGWSGTVTPTKAGYAFSPPSRDYADVTSDQQNQNYSASIFKPALTIVCGDGGMTTPSPGTYVYDYGTEVSITATPDSGCRCAAWTDDVPAGCENDNPITIVMDSNKTITANFIAQHTLIIATGTGGTTDPAPGSYPYDRGTQVSVTATVTSTGYQFSHWSGDASGTATTITITMDSDKSITASFSPIPDGGTGDGDGGKAGKKGGCFIATAAYGSPLHPHLDILRDFRDKYLMPNRFGRKLVELYYRYSPSIADFIAKHKLLKVAVRINLIPVIAFSSLMVHFGPVATAVVLVFMLGFPILFIRFYQGKGKVL